MVGGGPGGLGAAAVLEGWRPRLRDGVPFSFRVPGVEDMARAHVDDLLKVDMRAVAETGLRPIDFFRSLHHPSGAASSPGDLPLEFSKGQGADWLMLTTDPPGGLWNNVPRDQLTLSPGHWMEMAPYPLAQFANETGLPLDPDALIHKNPLVEYYHALPDRLGLSSRIRRGERVTRICPAQDTGQGRFVVESVSSPDGIKHVRTSNCLVFGIGPRSLLRQLDVPGIDLPYVNTHYDHPDSFPGDRVLIVGGGRSADWAATELHDAGKHVAYAMRQQRDVHLRLINDSQNLPYYARIAEIMTSDSGRLGLLYGSHARQFLPGGQVEIDTPEGLVTLEVDHVVVEIGGDPDYGLLSGFPPLTLVPMRDRYRFQLMQMSVDPATFESVDIPGLYPAGYLAEGTGLSVIGFHAGAYLMGGDILRRLGRV